MVSSDHHGYSISFNEYLQNYGPLPRIQFLKPVLGQWALLLNFYKLCFRYLDHTNSVEISEQMFRKIMKNKEVVPDEDIEEMIVGDAINIYKI